VRVAEGRRYSFEDAQARRARELEDELSLQRQVIKGEAEQQIADIQRVGTAARVGLDHAAAERNNGIHWGATEEWEALDKTVNARSAELERAGEEIERASTDAREKVEQTAAAEARRIDEQVAASRDAMRKVATKETTAFEESLRARLVEIEDALRDQATQTRYDMRRAAEEEAANFDQIAGKRVAELQDTVRKHSELLDEFTHLHASTLEQLEEARTLAADLQRDAQERDADLEAPGAPASTPDLRGLDHEGRPVGIETAADVRFAELNGHVERSEATQRAMEERIADLETEVAESVEALEARAATDDVTAGVRTEELEAALAATASQFEARLRAAAEEHARKLEQAGVVTRNQLLDTLARAEDGLAQAADARATDLAEMIAAARTAIERAADSRVQSLETAAVDVRDGIEELHRDIAAALTQSGEAQAAALDRAANDWLKRMDRNAAKNGGRRRRAAPGAAAVVLAIAAALGGTMLFRGGGGGRPTVARADSGSPGSTVPAATSTPVDQSKVSEVANALSTISWPSATAPLGSRTQGTSPSGTNGSSPTGTGAAGGGTAAAGGGQAQPPATPAPTQPAPPPPPPPPPPTLLPPITLTLPDLR
jgi:hypothetical protein